MRKVFIYCEGPVFVLPEFNALRKQAKQERTGRFSPVGT